MKKIIIIGCPGSGKSTFALKLNKIISVPLYHLDMIYWKEDKTHLSSDELLYKLEDIVCENEWIIDGNYISTMEARLKYCDTVFFLDYPVDICIEGVKSRIGRQRVDMPWVETEEDEGFIDYIINFDKSIRPEIISLLGKYNNKNIIIFNNREESEKYLKSIT